MRIIDSDDPVTLICDEVAKLPVTKDRCLIAIAGPPASGKTTLASKVAEALNQSTHEAKFFPMDGFHLDNRILIERDRLAEKGAPDTFDADGFVNAVKRLKTENSVVLPEFDRDRELAVAGAIVVEQRDRFIVAEGNFLCFDAPPWDQLLPMWDLSIYLDVSRGELERRLVQRWLDQGFTPEAAHHRTDVYDLPNADRVAASRLRTDLVIRSGYV